MQQPEVFDNSKKFPQQVGRLGDEITLSRNACCIFVSEGFCQVQCPADVKAVADNADGSMCGKKCPGKDQIFPGIGGLAEASVQGSLLPLPPETMRMVSGFADA